MNTYDKFPQELPASVVGKLWDRFIVVSSPIHSNEVTALFHQDKLERAIQYQLAYSAMYPSDNFAVYYKKDGQYLLVPVKKWIDAVCHITSVTNELA